MKPPPQDLHMRLVTAIATLSPRDRATLRDPSHPSVQGGRKAREAKVLGTLPSVANDTEPVRGRALRVVR